MFLSWSFLAIATYSAVSCPYVDSKIFFYLVYIF